MVLVGLLVTVFLLFEARRYRYFNVWRARARLLETDFCAPMIRGEGIRLGASWAELLAKDYCDPRYHISFIRAIGRRLRRTCIWIFVIQAVANYGKLAIHPAATDQPCRRLGACRHWSDPRWGGSAIPWRMGGIRAPNSRRERRSLIAMG